MTCYHPLKAFSRGLKDNGKKDLIITSANVDHIEIYKSHEYQIVSKKIQTPHPLDTKFIYDSILIPCGQCIGCRIDYSRDWANRMMCELESHDKACFITLTYNDDNVPLTEYVDNDGEIQYSMTLVRRDFQLFMKRLRKSLEPLKIRFYACGEYGDKYYRPHYHAIIFGYDFSDDREFLKSSLEGFPYYRSESLERLWPYGYSMVCDVSWQTCAYVARYVTKKHKGFEKCYYDYFNIEPEFSLMSRRPGIGKDYYTLHRDEIYNRCEIFFQTMKGGIKTRPPRYFDKLYDLEFPEKLIAIKKLRQKMADNISSEKLKKTNLSLPELLEIEERSFSDRIKVLGREYCEKSL